MLAVNNIVTETYTNSSGYSLYLALKDNFIKDQPVELSFDGITSTSSSFLNSSFGALIDEFGLIKFMSLVKIKMITKGEAEIIKKYIAGFKDSSNNVQ